MGDETEEKLPSAQERYQKEIIRVLGVLESVLSKQEWLVGNKFTIADLSFFPWNNFAVSLSLFLFSWEVYIYIDKLSSSTMMDIGRGPRQRLQQL
jgi:glutathione S-transferase